MRTQNRHLMPNWSEQPQQYQPCVRECVRMGHPSGFCEQRCLPRVDAVLPLHRPAMPHYSYPSRYFESYPLSTLDHRQYGYYVV